MCKKNVEIFSYTSLPPDERQWLREQTTRIHRRLHQTVESIMEVGRMLCEVKERLPGCFLAWLDLEFDLGNPATASRWMRVWRVFGGVWDVSKGQINAVALYELSRETTPQSAREYAVELAQQGEHITTAKAREIIKSFRSPSAESVRAYRPPEADEPRNYGKPIRDDLAERLCAIGQRGRVVIESIPDDNSRSAGMWRIVVEGIGVKDLACPEATGATLIECANLILGRVEMRRCAICRKPKPVENFCINARGPGGRNTTCKPCESKRVTRWKSRKRSAVQTNKLTATP